MKVILTQTVPKVGKEGHVVNVANGYARNYLFPRGMALFADKAQMAILERRRAKMASEDASTLSNAEGLHEKLNGKSIRIEGKVAGENTRLFGAVTSQDIADTIAAQLSVTLDKKQVALLVPIKQLGKYQIEIDLHRQLNTTVNLDVFNPAAEAVAEKPAVEAEVEVVADAPVAEEEEGSDEPVEE